MYWDSRFWLGPCKPQRTRQRADSSIRHQSVFGIDQQRRILARRPRRKDNEQRLGRPVHAEHSWIAPRAHAVQLHAKMFHQLLLSYRRGLLAETAISGPLAKAGFVQPRWPASTADVPPQLRRRSPHRS